MRQLYPENLKSLTQPDVYDNASGNASNTANKTSVYLHDSHHGLVARVCNISCTNIDGHGTDPAYHGVDDFALFYEILVELVTHYVMPGEEERFSLIMNSTALQQVTKDWLFRHGEAAITEPEPFAKFMGIRIAVDNTILCNEDTTI